VVPQVAVQGDGKSRIHPQEFRGFADLLSHPWVTGMAEALCGPPHEIVEIGFDTPLQGAKNQPWQRDFAAPPEIYQDRKLTSLACNRTGVDVTTAMAPFEIAPGSQGVDGREWHNEMFPPTAAWPEFADRGVRKFPQMGDMSCRPALTLHTGTAHALPTPDLYWLSASMRPVLVIQPCTIGW
jgi:hypothetical protein